MGAAVAMGKEWNCQGQAGEAESKSPGLASSPEISGGRKLTVTAPCLHLEIHASLVSAACHSNFFRLPSPDPACLSPCASCFLHLCSYCSRLGSHVLSRNTSCPAPSHWPLGWLLPIRVHTRSSSSPVCVKQGLLLTLILLLPKLRTA